jgi:pimeloyl-ACP methyl ester carboxylesterase
VIGETAVSTEEVALMPRSRNRLDGRRVYFEDEGGDGAPVVFHGGFLDSVADVRESNIAQALPADEFRRIYVDHRGLGASDKPHDIAAYAIEVRVADAVGVLDELSIERAHFVGMSWGGRLGFGIGEHGQERVLSLVIGGQQPYEWPYSRSPGRSATGSRRLEPRAPRAWSKRWRRSGTSAFPMSPEHGGSPMTPLPSRQHGRRHSRKDRSLTI